MTKIMLVEDDKSLREIYGVRLLAEGYDIVSAGDGEEALAMAIKERPNLIVSDVMMPKISGFDMLDILRSTTETRDIKVIMMTALSSEEQRARGQSLGADRYLVKSQVGIEDVVHVVHEVLGDAQNGSQAANSVPVANNWPQQARPAPPQQQQRTPPQAAQAAPPQSAPVQAPQNTGFTYQSNQPDTIPNSIPRPMQVQPQRVSLSQKPVGSGNRVIQPLNDPAANPLNINELLDRELAKEAGLAESERPAVVSTEQERAVINTQIEQFDPSVNPSPQLEREDTLPHIAISEEGTIQQDQPLSQPQVVANEQTQTLPPQPPVSQPYQQPSQPVPPQTPQQNPLAQPQQPANPGQPAYNVAPRFTPPPRPMQPPQPPIPPAPASPPAQYPMPPQPPVQQ